MKNTHDNNALTLMKLTLLAALKACSTRRILFKSIRVELTNQQEWSLHIIELSKVHIVKNSHHSGVLTVSGSDPLVSP